MKDSQKDGNNMANELVTTTTSKDALAILAASDDRELLAQGMDDFLPYDIKFDILVDFVELKAKKNHDNRGVFCTFKVLESDNPENVRVGKTYVIAFFDTHKTVPEFVIGKMAQKRREFAAVIAGVPCDDAFQAAPVLLQLHNEVEPLGIKMRIRNEYLRPTRTGKAIHELRFALAS